MQKKRIGRKVIPVHFRDSQWHKIAAAAIKADKSVSGYIREAAIEKAESGAEANAA